MKKIYNFDPVTGFYMGEGEADESPLEPGVLLMPPGATLVAPPAPRLGYLLRWKNGKWGFSRGDNPFGEPVQEPQPIATDYSAAVQVWLDAKARSLNYDSIASAITYRGDPNPKFAAEAEAFFSWRSEVWTFCYEELAKWEAGERDRPTIEAFIEELPELKLPG